MMIINYNIFIIFQFKAILHVNIETRQNNIFNEDILN